jgi:hypothetical protein
VNTITPNLEELDYIPSKGMFRVPDEFWVENIFAACRITFRWILSLERCV